MGFLGCRSEVSSSKEIAPEPSLSQGGSASIDRVGGRWVTCYGGFAPQGDVERDLDELGRRCGAGVGLQRVGERLRGALLEGAEGRFPLALGLGDCARLLSVGESTLIDLDVRVVDAKGAQIAVDSSQDAWPVVEPERPFCLRDNTALFAEVTARRGRGSFALDLFRIPRPGPPGAGLP